MNADMTADGMFSGGREAPCGTYLCLSTGLVHRLSRPTALPEGGPFRMVAPTCTLTVAAPPVPDARPAPLGLDRWTQPVTAHRWPEDESRPSVDDPGLGWWQIMLLCRLGRSGHWF